MITMELSLHCIELIVDFIAQSLNLKGNQFIYYFIFLVVNKQI